MTPVISMDTDQNCFGPPYALFVIVFFFRILIFLVRYLIEKYTGQLQRPGRPTSPVWRKPYIRSFNQEWCPICLSAPSLPLTTNCGHVFCGPCLRAVWLATQHHGEAATIPCPMCRGKVHQILPLNPDEVLYSRVMMPAPPPRGPGEDADATAPPTPPMPPTSYLTLYDFVAAFNATQRRRRRSRHWWCRPVVFRCGRAVVEASRRLHYLLFDCGYQNPTVGAVLSAVVPLLYVSRPQQDAGDQCSVWEYLDDMVVILLCSVPFYHYVTRIIHPPQQS